MSALSNPTIFCLILNNGHCILPSVSPLYLLLLVHLTPFAVCHTCQTLPLWLICAPFLPLWPENEYLDSLPS